MREQTPNKTINEKIMHDQFIAKIENRKGAPFGRIGEEGDNVQHEPNRSRATWRLYSTVRGRAIIVDSARTNNGQHTTPHTRYSFIIRVRKTTQPRQRS